LFILSWLINLLKNFFQKKSIITSTLTQMVITSFIVYPHVVSAGLFSGPVSAYTPRIENIQTLPILQARLSPMVLTSVGGPDPVIDGDSMSGKIGLYDIIDIDISETDTISSYVVQSGDTLSEIADQFGVSTNTIRWANNITKNQNIRVGQTLIILPVSGVRHVVQKGDTLATIAKKYKADTEEIATYNNLDSGEKITVGSTVIVPNGEVSVVETKTVTSVTTKYTDTVAKITKNNESKTSSSGYFIRPMKGIKTQGFHGPYNAVDIGAPVGTPIVAAADGVVLTAKPLGYNGGYGGLTIIQHSNGSQSLYAHQSSISVAAGEKVSQGQQIGKSGNTGRSTGPHLHLEFRGVKTPILY
jgi:murein DD-endopeptidase MepM/ murein hydrolase activator NlpD